MSTAWTAAGVLPVAGLALREAWRSHLWIVPLLAAAAVLAAAPSLAAVDEGSRLKLAMVAGSTVTGFTGVLLALLVASAQVRRDLDTRVAFLLFSKPLTRGGYLLGRFLGGVTLALVALLAVASATALTVVWRFGASPAIHATLAPATIQQVSQLGEAVAVAESRETATLDGPAGNGVRWRFTGLDPAVPAVAVLVKIGIRSPDPELLIEESAVELTVLPPPGATTVPRRLELDPSSPYGRGSAAIETRPGEVWLRHRDASRNDLSSDYARLRLPMTAIAPDGSATIQLTRLDGRVSLVVPRSGACFIASDGGSLALNLARSALVDLAPCAMLVAVGILVATVSNLTVALLAGLTLHFCTQVHWILRDTLEYEQVSVPVRRLIDLALAAFPDAERHGTAVHLAASQAVGWQQVGSGWAAYAPWIVGLLALAWLSLARKEFR